MIRTHRPVDRRSRLQRWDDATNLLLGIQAECVNWLEALPDSLRAAAMAEALEAIADLDLATLAEVKPPRGYGPKSRFTPGWVAMMPSRLPLMICWFGYERTACLDDSGRVPGAMRPTTGNGS